MKSLFSIFLTAIIVLHSFSNLLLYASFKIKQDEIAKTLCVLREQKNNSCNGNCVLRAELKKQAESEQKHATILKEKAEIVYTISEITSNFSAFVSCQTEQALFFFNTQKPNSVSLGIFHPPTA